MSAIQRPARFTIRYQMWGKEDTLQAAQEWRARGRRQHTRINRRAL